MRPALKSGLMPVWRDRDTLQIGIDPRRAIALSGMRQAGFVIGLLDGSRERDQVVAAATAHGISVQATERILTLLAAGGALDDFPAGTWRSIPSAHRARLAPELATTSLAHRDGDGGARTLARRRAAVVRVEGDQRIGRPVSRILSAAGVGRVEFVRQMLPQPDRPDQADQADVADLVILAGRQPLSRLAQLARERVPHLAVAAGEAIGVVGPMVVPKRTACLLCMDYVRAGNDSAWPLILAQLGRRRPDPPACDAVLAAAVAAQAAAQALVAIAQNPLSSAAVNGTLELVLPDWKWRRRTWGPHPACPCSGTSPDNRQ
jgi:bacteriocin biosynthesis cyclodehydratase domain-containing protein